MNSYKHFRSLLLSVLFLSLGFYFAAPYIARTSAAPTELLTNGGFETGTNEGWNNEYFQGAITSSDVFEGSYALHITNGSFVRQGWINVIPGEEYVLTGYFKWNSLSNSNWGRPRVAVYNNSWATVAQIDNLDQLFPQSTWGLVTV